MMLPKSMHKTIRNFSKANDDEGLCQYLREALEQKHISPKDLLIYARDFQWHDTLEYVINETVINRLGEAINICSDTEKMKYAAHFFILAARRGSSLGHTNCIPYFLYGDKGSGVQQSLKRAFKYARRAIALAKNKEEYERIFSLLRALQEK